MDCNNENFKKEHILQNQLYGNNPLACVLTLAKITLKKKSKEHEPLFYVDSILCLRSMVSKS
jgi:hypothetical protein